ncbi:hypothetical protein L210DRAFT_2135808 [Boletus edulis BED1]|uniref:Uncharacterized protein n=1 Tax=Boletus edulis BED1 TaxID=1328754 RepID=A0AAD4BEZ4_BOLED|nr:hypothetical protein L210DRAFT_2135808 [Boletus edulis BED1]
MASPLLRCTALARNFVQRTGRTHARLLSTSPITRNDAPNLGTVSSPKKPIGGFRGGIIGFLFGFSLASAYAAYHLLDEYKTASAALQASVDELQASTAKVTAHVRRIEGVEKDLKTLSQHSASKDDLSRVRAEVKKLYDGLHIGPCRFADVFGFPWKCCPIEFLDLRNHVWGMQQDLHALAKKEAVPVRE